MSEPRVLKLTAAPMKGSAAWEMEINRQFASLGIGFRVKVDDTYTKADRDATRRLLYALGIDRDEMAQGVTPELRIRIRRRDLTDAERERMAERVEWRRRLRKRYAPKMPTYSISTAGGARGIVEQAVAIAQKAGGDSIYVGSDHRPGERLPSGQPSDHSRDDAGMAARDIGKRGVDLIHGPPSPELDRATVAIGKAFGRDYGDGRGAVIDTFAWRGFRVQVIYRTSAYGGHLGHQHLGVRAL